MIMPKEQAQDVIAYVLGFKPVRTVMHRLLIISLHIVLWGLFLSLPMLIYRIEILDSTFLYRELINKSFLIILFYFHYYYLIPKFFRKGRMLNYFLLVFVTLIVICAQQLTVEYYFQDLFRKKTGFTLVGRPGRPPKFFHHLSPVAKARMMPFAAGRVQARDSIQLSSGAMLFGERTGRSAITGNKSSAKSFFDSATDIGRDVPEPSFAFSQTEFVGVQGRYAGAHTKILTAASDDAWFVRQDRIRREKFRQANLRNNVMYMGPTESLAIGTVLPSPGQPSIATIGTPLPVMSLPFTLIDTLVDKGTLPLNLSPRSQFKNDPPESMPFAATFMANGPFGGRKIPTLKLFGTEIPLIALPMLMMDTLTSAIIILLISGFIKLANSLVISEKQKKVLENERLNAELNFLKLQINPHFLFNTLNSIYSQAHLKSEQTEYSILKFSQIMRYVLYDSAAEKIPLAKDLEYIRNYIDLQKIRISKNVTIHYSVTGNTGNLVIAPLLLITFIENAFKHGVSYTVPSEIRINIELVQKTLLLTVGNAVTAQREKDHDGVGLINARRRLDVLYPGRYLLDVVENNSLYIVNLKIDLDHETEHDNFSHQKIKG